MEAKKPDATEASRHTAKDEQVADASSDPENKVPEGAENFEHTLRRLYILKQGLRR
jgi:hypothetical protein